jgi:RND family efflux transporter MFP subunit
LFNANDRRPVLSLFPSTSPIARPRTAVGAVVVAAALLLVSACGAPESSSRARAEQPPPAVEVLAAQAGTLPLEERLSGVVKAENQVAIYPEISAPIVEVMVRSGEKVRRGQPLVRLESDELNDQLRQAEAAAQLAQASAEEAQARVDESVAQVTRTRALAAQQLVSDVELETQEARLNAIRAGAAQAAARVAQAKATTEERRSALTNTLIRAPIDGSVGQRNAEVGMLADGNTLLFQIGNLDSLIIEVPLTEGMLAYIGEGLPVRLSAASLGDVSLKAELSRISPFLQQTSFSTIGEIDVENTDGKLNPGMFVTVDVLYGESENATIVPTSALWEDPGTGLLGVFVANLPLAPAQEQIQPTSLTDTQPPASEVTAMEFRPVDVLARGRQTVGISGVEPGEWVVTVGQNLLSELEEPRAHVRETSWEKVIDLQSLQREDLLENFLDKQRLLAKTVGVEPPTTEEFVAAPATSSSGTSRTPLSRAVAP